MRDNMRTYSKIIAIAFVLMMIAVPVLAIGSSSEGDVGVDSKNVNIHNFDDFGGGSIEVPITGGTSGQEYTVSVKNEAGDKEYDSTKVTAGTDGTATAKLSWNFGSSGDKTVCIYIDGKLADGGVHIYSSHSMWKDPVTYVAIVVVIILIIVAVYVKMRGLPGKKKDKKKDKTFAQIEAERKEKSGEKKSFFAKKSEEKTVAVQDDTTSTEKQSYTPGKGFFRKRNQ